MPISFKATVSLHRGFSGAYPTLRTVPNCDISKMEGDRLVLNATKLLLSLVKSVLPSYPQRSQFVHSILCRKAWTSPPASISERPLAQNYSTCSHSKQKIDRPRPFGVKSELQAVPAAPLPNEPAAPRYPFELVRWWRHDLSGCCLFWLALTYWPISER